MNRVQKMMLGANIPAGISLLILFLSGCLLSSCSTENVLWNDPDKPAENTPANNMGSETTESMDSIPRNRQFLT